MCSHYLQNSGKFADLMALSYVLAEHGAMNDEDDPDWYQSYLKRLRASLLISEPTVGKSTSPLQYQAAQQSKNNIEIVPTSIESGARLIRQAELMELHESQLNELFPALTEFWRQQKHYRSRSSIVLPQSMEFTAQQSSPTQLPDEHTESATKTFGQRAKKLARSARKRLLRNNQKRIDPRKSASKMSDDSVPNGDRKLFEQFLEEEALEQQMNMIHQQELK